MKRVLMSGVLVCAAALPVSSAFAAGAAAPKTMMAKPQPRVAAPMVLAPAPVPAEAAKATAAAPAISAKKAARQSAAAVAPVPAEAAPASAVPVAPVAKSKPAKAAAAPVTEAAAANDDTKAIRIRTAAPATKDAPKPATASAATPVPVPAPVARPQPAKAAEPVAAKPASLVTATTPAASAAPTSGTTAPQRTAAASAEAPKTVTITAPVQASLGSVPLPLPFPSRRAAQQGGPVLAFANPDKVSPAAKPEAAAPLFAEPAQPAVAAPSGKQGLSELVARIARENGLPFGLAHGVVMVESRYNPGVTGPGGHVGLTQISYPTAKSLGYSGTRAGLYDPQTNLTYGLKYLGRAYELAKGDMCGAISKYQGGHRIQGVTRAGNAYCAKVRKIIAAGLPGTITADATPATKATKKAD